jgi:hypothetical protein
MVEQITMNVDETLELDYLVEDISNDTINVKDEPSNFSTEIGYIRKEIGVFDPPGAGTYQLEINGQTIEIKVTNIPDSGNLYADYNAIELQLSDGETVNTFSDAENQNDLTATGTPTFKTNVQNGNPVVRYGGVDDYHNAASTDNFGTLSPPFTIYHTVQFRGYLSAYGSTAEANPDSHYVRVEDETFRLDVLGTNSGDTSGSVATDTWFVVTWDVDSGSEDLRVNGASDQQVDQSADLNGYAMGYEPEGNEDYLDGDIGRSLVYDTDHSESTMSDVESFLANEWGVTL